MVKSQQSADRPRLPLRQTGVTLVEVLVTMVIIALGLLGHAKLLTATVNQSNAAYMRSVATMLTYDIMECIRANRVVSHSGSYNIAIGSAATGGSVSGNDLVAWKSQLRTALPSGDGSVNVGIDGTTTIVIRWDERISVPRAQSGCTSTTAPTDPTTFRCFSTQTAI